MSHWWPLKIKYFLIFFFGCLHLNSKIDSSSQGYATVSCRKVSAPLPYGEWGSAAEEKNWSVNSLRWGYYYCTCAWSVQDKVMCRAINTPRPTSEWAKLARRLSKVRRIKCNVRSLVHGWTLDGPQRAQFVCAWWAQTTVGQIAVERSKQHSAARDVMRTSNFSLTHRALRL